MDGLIAKYKAQLKSKEEEIDDINETYDNFDEFNAYDASGGNSDDAYSLGEDHGGAFTSWELLEKFVKDLEKLAKGGR